MQSNFCTSWTGVTQLLEAREQINFKVGFPYLATGCYFAALHYAYRLGKSTVIVIVQKTVYVIWKKLKDRVMKVPSTEEWMEIATGFEKYTNFPNCIGAVDVGDEAFSLSKYYATVLRSRRSEYDYNADYFMKEGRLPWQDKMI
ncbi:hypothetical protein ACJJTC_014436 [Scirpophaga incertulas]